MFCYILGKTTASLLHEEQLLLNKQQQICGGLSKNKTGRWDRTEHPSRCWRLYRRPDDKTGRTTVDGTA